MFSVLSFISKTSIALSFLAIVLFPAISFASSLAFSPAVKNYEQGALFTVAVRVQSGGGAINAVSGVLSFPKEKVEVVSISKNQTIVSLWVEEPSFSNEGGTVSFEGIILNPGYSGNGQVLSVTFRARTSGIVSLSFLRGSVLANDGQGTETLSSLGTAAFTITAPTENPQEEPQTELETVQPTSVDDTSTVPGPVVTVSGMHHAPWIASSSAVFNFQFDASVTAIRLLFDDSAISIPTVTYRPATTSRTITDIADGVHYLHAQVESGGVWSEVVHTKVQRDSLDPLEPSVEVVSTSGDIGIFTLSGEDADSPVTRLEVSVDGGEFIVAGEGAFVTFLTQKLPKGEHSLVVRAYDASGNYSEKSITFTLEGDTLSTVPTEQSEQTIVGAFIQKGGLLVALLSVLIPICALLFLTAFSFIYLLGRYRRYKKAVHNETQEALTILRSSVTLVLAELENDIAMLSKAKKKRKLTREEAKLFKNLTLNLEGARAVMEKEIGDIDSQQ